METSAVSIPAIQPIMLNVEDAARYLGCTPWAIRRMLYAGKLPYKRAGKRNVIPRAALEDYARNDLVREGAEIAPRKGRRA
jgi:excisionase family DNA binding protein